MNKLLEGIAIMVKGKSIVCGFVLFGALNTGCSMMEDFTGGSPDRRKEVDSAISQYHDKAGRVKIGDPKDAVLQILMPTQEGLPPSTRRAPEAYKEGEDTIEIYYFRTGWTRDGRTTDDEFTPYVFKNGVLQAVGWMTLGGPKTHSGILGK
jgi:hypothetical protein